MSVITPEHRRAIWMLLLANLLWGISFPLIKGMALIQERVVPGSSSWYITATTLVPRFTLAAAILAAGCWATMRTLTRREWHQGLVLGLFAVGGMILQNDGLQYTSASTSAFLTQLYAVMIPAYFAVRHARLPPWPVWTACGLVLAGVSVLAQVDWREFRIGRGELETLIGSFFFMGQILWLERPEFAGNRALGVTVVMFAVEAVIAAMMMPALAPAGVSLLPLYTNLPWLGFMLAITILCTLVSFTLMNVFQPRITSTEAGVLYTAEPVFTAVMALFLPAWFSVWGGFNYPNETATPHLLIGGGLITAANLVVQVRGVRR
jgi:drug/metabolite transporter (DMT)-like permease